MKKQFISLAFLLTIGCSYAQDIVSTEFKFFRTGFTLTPSAINWFSSVPSPFEKEGAVFSFVPSWFMDFQLTSRLYLSTGLSYSTLGGNLSFPNLTIDALPNFSTQERMNRKYNLQYLDIPVMIKIYSNQFNSWSFYGGLGARLGMKMKAKAYNEYLDFSYIPGGASTPVFKGTFTEDEDLKKKIKFLNVAATAEFGTTYQLSEEVALLLSVNYNFGLTSVFTKDHEIVNNVFPNAKTQQISICVGLIF